MSKAEDARKKRIKKLANQIAKQTDSDLLIFNFGLETGIDLALLAALTKRKLKKRNLILFLTTEGGDADTGYRMARYLQDNYECLTIVVTGWCKSAGTLMCVAANELVIADTGELGPIDVQIAKTDELGERSSGLAVEAAFEKLQQECIKMFVSHLNHIKDKTGGRITFRTAADLAAQLVTGATASIFAKIDPMAVGEDFRSNLIAESTRPGSTSRARIS